MRRRGYPTIAKVFVKELSANPIGGYLCHGATRAQMLRGKGPIASLSYVPLSPHAKLNRFIHPNPKIALISLNNPPVNSLNPKLFQEMTAIVDQVNKDKAAVGLIIESSLPSIFSAGLDLNFILIREHELKEQAERRFRAYFQQFQGLLQSIMSFDGCSVALLRGAAPAGGTVLSMMTDHRIAIENAKFSMGFSEVSVGLAPPTWIYALAEQKLGVANATKYVKHGLLVRNIKEALALGFVDQVVDGDANALISATREIERNLVLPPLARSRTKKMLNERVSRLMNDQAVDYFLASLLGNEFQETVLDVFQSLERKKK